MYESPLPADLELLTTRLGILAQHLENGTTFDVVTLDKDEKDMLSHLYRIEATCSKMAAEYTLVQGHWIVLVNHGQKRTSLHERFASMATENE